jgi:hypothetical protein
LTEGASDVITLADMLRPRLILLLVFAWSAAVAADDPFAEGKVEIRHEGERRILVFEARNVSGKDVQTMVIAYVLRDQKGNVVESDVLRCARKDGGPAVAKDFAGAVWEMPIIEDNVVTVSFGCQEAVFADGTRWVAPTRRGKP